MKLAFASLALFASTVFASAPKVGDQVADFELKTPDGKAVTLDSVTRDGDALIVVLRGYPGYQCPLCSRQYGEFASKADQFAARKMSLVFVYPGGVDDLGAKAGEFLKGRSIPENVTFLLDPNYKFTNAWGLRWDAPRETAYPSTFVVGSDGVVKSAVVSKSHSGRTSAASYLK